MGEASGERGEREACPLGGFCAHRFRGSMGSGSMAARDQLLEAAVWQGFARAVAVGGFRAFFERHPAVVEYSGFGAMICRRPHTL